MNYKEYGKNNSEVIILLHGGGLSWWNYKEEAMLLKDKYHVIIPILDGHPDSDEDFTTIHHNANKIIAFIDECFNGKVLLMAGLSLGGQILTEILSIREDICSFSIIESALVIPSLLTKVLVSPAISSSYGLIKHKWFSKLQFKALRINSKYFDEYYHDTCAITKNNMIAFLRENALYSLNDSLKSTKVKVHIFAGSKENKNILKSAQLLHNNIPSSELHILKDLYHGEFSINNPILYISELEKIVSSSY